MKIRRAFALAALAAASFLATHPRSRAAETGNWRDVAIVRIDNVDAVDSEDGPLADFLKGFRDDGSFPPPLKTLVGPSIRNPTFFGLVGDAWLEIAVLAPNRPGPLATVWIFPVDDRDEYVGQMIQQGLSGFEGMDGVTVLGEMDSDGNSRSWYLEWLPGEVAFFGDDRSAVGAARRLYAENGAAGGLLADRSSSFIKPDIAVNLDPPTLAAWQDSAPGRYWWREKVLALARDLVEFWQPGSARRRVVFSLAEELAVWPRRLEPIRVNVWFEETGVKWTLETAGESDGQPALSQLESLRRLPERTALAYAAPVTPASFRGMGELAGRLLLAGAGGAVSAEARSDALVLFDTLSRAMPTQAATAWVQPPAGSPELMGTRLLVTRWERPELLSLAWEMFEEYRRPDTPVSRALAQLGWEVRTSTENRPEGVAGVGIYSVATDRDAPFYTASLVMRRNGSWVVLAAGPEHPDPEANRRILNHRMEIADNAAAENGEGVPAVRSAFTKMGPRGAGFLAILDPVRFIQLSLIESADWGRRTLDRNEPDSTRYAREMLEYDSGGAWSAVGEREGRLWRCNGEIGWPSLSRLAGALGIAGFNWTE